MQNDWRSHPAWGPTQTIIGGIGVLIALIAIDISTIIKIVIFIGAAVACIYTFLGKKNSTPAMERNSASSSAVATSFEPTDLGDKSYVQPAPILQHPQSHPNDSTTPAVAEKPGDTESASKTEEKSSSFSWKERIGGFFACAILYGIPGILLLRSGVGLLHIIGIVILVFLGFAVIGFIIP